LKPRLTKINTHSYNCTIKSAEPRSIRIRLSEILKQLLSIEAERSKFEQQALNNANRGKSWGQSSEFKLTTQSFGILPLGAVISADQSVANQLTGIFLWKESYT